MKAEWNAEKKQYGINLTEKELGALIFGLTVAKYETNDTAVAELQNKFLELNNS